MRYPAKTCCMRASGIVPQASGTTRRLTTRPRWVCSHLALACSDGATVGLAAPSRVPLPMDFRILGSLEVVDQGRVVVLGGRRQRALLALLLLHVNEALSFDRLIDE